MSMTPDEQRAAIKAGQTIAYDLFKKAEERWSNTEASNKQRPWPRCYNAECNLTVICQGNDKCEGFDY